jgi:hypothetical protein
VVLLYLLRLLVVVLPLLLLLKRRKKRNQKKRRRYVLTFCQLLTSTELLVHMKEESDEDMIFGLFDD